VPTVPRGVVPLPRDPETIVGAGELPEVAGVTYVEPAPAPAPALTPDVSTPVAPVERFAFDAMVSLMLSPLRGLVVLNGFSLVSATIDRPP